MTSIRDAVKLTNAGAAINRLKQERDTYRDLCAELLGALRINREAMSMVLNGETLEWHTGHAAVSAHDIAIQSITKAESILGESQ